MANKETIMTDAELFDRFVKTRGMGTRFEPKGRMTVEDWNRSYGHIHKYAEHLIGSARSLIPKLPPIYFDFIYNPEVNAYAFKDEGRYFMGITTGLMFMAEFVFFRMPSDGRIFSNIGNSAVEQGSFPPLSDYTTDAQEMSRKGVHTGPPKDPGRFVYAVDLLTSAMFFVIGHELAHITRGHVDFLDSQNGTPIISECDEPNKDVLGAAWNLPIEQKKAERQAIEMDADQRSVRSSIASVKNKLESPEMAVMLNGRNTIECLLFDWSVAMNTFFRLFGDLRATQTNVQLGYYPPMPLRRFMAVKMAAGAVITAWKAPIAATDAIRLLRDGAVYPETMFQILTGQPSGNGVNDAFGQEGDEYSIKLYRYWKETLAPKIQKHAFEFGPEFGLEEVAKPAPRTTP
jgi:hypothetical protein